ncbi:MAG: hypothetical protein ACJA0I_000409 [Gammaproteobacteria bacterium]|jgi:hypothetical protein
MSKIINLEKTILRFNDIDQSELINLLARYQLKVKITAPDKAIPGSFWGDEEAGLIGHEIFLRQDTPVHSILHETCHFICMDATRRKQLNTNAGNIQQEENAVCYLQILLADDLPSLGRQRMMFDMDTWGYSFRLGNAQNWFEHDAEEPRNWLLEHKLIDQCSRSTYQLRS